MAFFITPIVIALVVILILSVAFKNAPKIDRGTEFNYFKLSYRRKLIRTLTSFPIILLALIIVYSFTDSNMLLVGVLFIGGFIVQLLYNYTMWKKSIA